MFIARLNPHSGQVEEGSVEPIQMALGVQHDLEYDFPIEALEGSGVILHFESPHGSIFEKLITSKGDFLKVADFKIERVVPNDHLTLTP
jgi:hypothetical protein